ncbi:MAG: HAMP domain-containing sensor histidine kinase [Bdellovibrio sp.]
MKRRGTKLLIKVFVTFCFTAFLIIGGMAWIGHFLAQDKNLSPVIEKNAIAYFTTLNQRLQQDLTPKGMQKIYDDLHLKARVAGHETFANSHHLPSFADVDEEGSHFSNRLLLGKYRGYFFAEVKGAEPRTVWFISRSEIPRGWIFPFLWLAAFTLFIMAMSFLTIRWMMSPINVVVDGVNKISSGDLKYRIRTRHKGEFKMIGEAFNNMADGLEKMIAAREQLLRDVSHELRSPLTRVGVAVDLLNDENMKLSIKEDLQKMEELIHEILESYRLKEGARSLKKSAANLSELITHVASDFDSAASIRIQVPPEASLNIDVMQMERVLRNLLENAVKYSLPGNSPSIQISLKRDCNFWALKVKDAGIGIAEKDIGRIFEPFYRADSARSPGKSGFGLGLAIAKAVVEAHEGTLSVVSKLNEGCEFTIRLPS